MVVGLETHIELSTQSKIFCGCAVNFGGDPNTNCCPVCVGLPGALPRLNRQVVRYGVMAGLATNCTVNPVSYLDRKNYVYPDLPKAYQISQYDTPLCENGYLELSGGKKVRIARIHIEEDAGKLVYDGDKLYVDYNRSGVPLIEIVTQPDFRSADQVKEYLEKLQMLMRYIGISDCKMQEGSLRCDVNISVRKSGETAMGIRTEIKNMNSFRFITRALAYETQRQIACLSNGQAVVRETRRYNEQTGETQSMRGKEEAQDYRFFREPDLPAVLVSPEEVEQLRDAMPELPDARVQRYCKDYGLAVEDACLLAKYRKLSDYFEQAAQGLKAPKTIANFILGPIFRSLTTEEQKEAGALSISSQDLHELAAWVEEGKLQIGLAKTTLEQMLKTGKSLSVLLPAEQLGMMDEKELAALCRRAVEENPKAATDVKNGKEKAMGALVGAVMRFSRGKADAQQVNHMLHDLLC